MSNEGSRGLINSSTRLMYVCLSEKDIRKQYSCNLSVIFCLALGHHVHSVCVAQRSSLCVQKLLERCVTSQPTHIHFKVKRNILATIIKRYYRSAHLIQPSRQILLLPQPQNAIQISMVKEKQRIYQMSAHTPTNTKLPA